MPDLIVREPFLGYTRGSRVTDPAEVKAILAGPQRGHVIVTSPQAAGQAAAAQPPAPSAAKD